MDRAVVQGWGNLSPVISLLGDFWPGAYFVFIVQTAHCFRAVILTSFKFDREKRALADAKACHIHVSKETYFENMKEQKHLWLITCSFHSCQPVAGWLTYILVL